MHPSMTQAPNRANGWAAGSLAAPALMSAFQDGLPVRLISTPRDQLRTCRADEPLADVMRRNVEGYDFMPVIDKPSDSTDRIVGLIGLAGPAAPADPSGTVGDRMERLSEDNLIGANAGILSFVIGADDRPCRLVVSGARIDGLVSLSDIQKLPARAALFALITHVEMTMADAIRREWGMSMGWKERLSENRRNGIERRRAAVRSDDNWVDDILLTEFADKMTIIKKSKAFAWSRTQFQNEMTRAERLRNNLAHAKDYASSREDGAKVCQTVRMVGAWIERLNQWSPVPAQEGG